MVAGYTPNGLNRQATGSNDNTWGEVLNDEVILLVDEFIAGRTAFELSGTKTLTSGNGVSNEARMAILHVTGGAGGDIIIPARPKLYLVINDAAGDVRISPPGGAQATIEASEVVQIASDGVDCRTIGVGGKSWKDYVDEQAWSALQGDLPGQPGNADKVLSTDGMVAGWRSVTDLPPYINDQTARSAAADKRAVGFVYFG